jgi:hypothetical protein
MMDIEHTKEPWEAVTPCTGECCWHIQQVGNDSIFHINNPEISKCDADRIVACVNACASIENNELKNVSYAQLLESHQYYERALAQLEADKARLVEALNFTNEIFQTSRYSEIKALIAEMKVK